ncbi:pyridoxamine 5'-phosphate oxidase family protein [Wenjunlia tyrosinilytica]|nr:pyridoxamine 5'-phosphate oxidase family protein [Wenjunlia tyrosinilytica]
MATWRQFEEESPDLAAAVQARFRSAKSHVLATLRQDGSPRVSGTEVDFNGPDMTIGSMLGAVKARDLRRDGRFAIHAATNDDEALEGGDAKVAGYAVEVVGDAELTAAAQAAGQTDPFHAFRLDLTEVVLTSLAPGGQALLIQTWRPGEPVLRYERRNDDPVPRRL